MNNELPTHVGLILDGNRRWARQHGLPLVEGHRKGAETLRRVLDYGLERGIPYVSAYVFSTENWKRTKSEVKYLMGLLLEILGRDLAEMHQKGVKVVWLGSREGVSPKIQKVIDDAMELTKDNTRATFGLCLNHGGHREITEAVQRLVQSGARAEDITEEAITAALDGAEIPPIDLLVRTGGDQRISNFMLWRVAYSELVFTPTLWPDLSNEELDAILADYASRQRRFGK
jgi:undecaprenyl diphosphate synthase